MYWVHDSLDTFVFTPKHVTKGGTHIKDGIDLKRTMFLVIVALQPCLLFGMYNVGHQHYMWLDEVMYGGWMDGFWTKFLYGMGKVLPLVIVSYGVGLGVEFIFCWKKGHEINEGFLVSGMLIPLIMPADVPLWIVAVSTVFAVIIGKEIFGGTGMNILNVALTTRAFAFFAYPTQMTGNKVWIPMAADDAPVDAFTGETPLGHMFASVDNTKAIRAAQESVESGLLSPAEVAEMERTIELNGDAIVQAKAQLPDVIDAAVGFIPGSVGETSAIACILGAGILIMTGIGSWRIMLSMLAGGFAMGLIFNAAGANAFMEMPAHLHILCGGFMFGMVFMATDPVTAAQTTTGKWIYGFLCGFFAILIRVINPGFPEGVMLAILFMNVMAPMIDHYVIKSNINRRLERLKKKTDSHKPAPVAEEAIA